MDTLFEAGNLAAVALHGDPTDWRTGAALGLIGKTEEAVRLLSRFEEPEAQLHLGAAWWIGGDDERALRILSSLEHPRALAMCALLSRPRIPVLAQLAWARRGPQNVLGGVLADSRFEVQNISFHPDDLPNEARADIRQYFHEDAPPAFYICQMVEWHAIPPNVTALPCPIFGHTSDYDLFVQAVHPWLQAFDALVVVDHTEWETLKPTVRPPVFTFPKSFAVVPREATRASRSLDFFMSGTLLDPYHPDKARLYHQIQRMEALDTLFVNGFVPVYDALVKATRSCVTYVRHSGSMATRGLEALSMGCPVVAQRGSVLSLFVGEDEGVLSYDLEAGDVGAALSRIKANPDRFRESARRGANVIAREFSQERVASQYLRFLTWLASAPRQPRARIDPTSLHQKRVTYLKGTLPGNSSVMERLAVRSAAHWRAAEPEVRILNDLAREMVMVHAVRLREGVDPATRTAVRPAADALKQACTVYRRLLAEAPRALVPLFNYCRVLLHFGSDAQGTEAVGLISAALEVDPRDWEVDPLHDVFSADLFATHFNYRDYLETVSAALGAAPAQEERMVDLVRAALHFYRACAQGSPADFEAAATLDPRFAAYSLGWARVLATTGQHDGARAHLRPLVDDSILFIEAASVLRPIATDEDGERLARAARAHRQTLFLEAPHFRSFGLLPLRPGRWRRLSEWLRWVRGRAHVATRLALLVGGTRLLGPKGCIGLYAWMRRRAQSDSGLAPKLAEKLHGGPERRREGRAGHE